MNIKVICIGKLKEKYWAEGVEEYLKRLSPYAKVEILELKEYRQRDEGIAGEEKVKTEEGLEILDRIHNNDYVITLEVAGNSLSSEAFSEKIKTLSLDGTEELVFVIGGSLGLSSAVSNRSNYKLSFSDMTFPHQMMRVILLEQIYRAFKIIKGETYHK